MNSEGVAIVGSSVAGVRTARALRSEGYDGRIVLLGRENHVPYDKPPLSKQFLTGAFDEARITLLTTAEAAESDIDLRLGVAAVGVDTYSRAVHLADGSSLSYTKLVIATGADARPAPWAAQSGVHVVRTLDDGLRLRAALQIPGRVVVIGGGFIGAEVASTAMTAGHEVTVVDPSSAPMTRAMGPELGALLTAIHGRHGVASRFGCGVEAVSGEAGALQVTLSDGDVLAADTVVVGIGAIPNDQWLMNSSLTIDNGVVCDEFCRAVGDGDVFAVGDVARWQHTGHQESVRVEHWTNAADQAMCVAHNIVHPDDLMAYRPTEYVWSDQYGWKIQIAGRPGRGALHQLIGDPDTDSPQAAALYVDDRDLLCGIVTVNWPRAAMVCRQLITAGAPVAEAVATVALLPRSTATAAVAART
ncbi:MAG: FAD-dependent oxidoreductase [Mycobacterium sp.]